MSDKQQNGTVNFVGDMTQVQGLAIKTTLLTFITLGIYRFWARTRVRRYFWSGVTLDGHGFEYTGRGIEKLIGFLIAVAVLAIYLGVFQLLLTFAGMSMFDAGDPEGTGFQTFGATFLTSVVLAPLIFYAQYRARRYMLSRTKWKGIRFGAEQAAWGYAWRAVGHTLLTIVSLGTLLPRQTFYLEKYKTDRSWFGTAKFAQHGHWTQLYPAMRHVFLAVVLGAVAGGVLVAANAASLTTDEIIEPDFGRMFLGGSLMMAATIWFYIGLLYYSLHSYRILARHKTLDGVVTFVSEPRTGRMVGIYLLASLAISFIAGTLASLFGLICGLIANLFVTETLTEVAILAGEQSPIAFMIGFFSGYIAFFILAAILTLIMVQLPIIRHYAETTTLQNSEHLDSVSQREGDDMVEAEGFADALDVGAGF